MRERETKIKKRTTDHQSVHCLNAVHEAKRIYLEPVLGEW